MTRVGVAVPTREVAARNIQTNRVACLKEIAGCPEIYFILVGFPWFDQRWRFALAEVAITSAYDAIGEVLRVTIGMDIDQARHKIGVWRA